jgi:hypothetical protein
VKPDFRRPGLRSGDLTEQELAYGERWLWNARID